MIKKVKSQRLKCKIIELPAATALIFALLISLTPHPSPLTPAFAASEYESAENIAAGVIGTVGTTATREIYLEKVFQNSSNFGQDMYMAVYSRVKSEASDTALRRTLAAKPLTEEEIKLIVPGSNLAPFLAAKPNENLTPTQIATRRDEFEDFLAEEKLLADLESLTKMETEPTELFSNGDESDSGFDLIVDLAIIEAILFGDTQTILSNAGPAAPAGSNVVTTSSPRGQNSGSGASGTTPSAGSGSSSTGGSSSPTAGSGQSPGQQLGVISTSLSALTGGAITEVAGELCPANQSFHDAVEQARARERVSGGQSASGLIAADAEVNGGQNSGQSGNGSSSSGGFQNQAGTQAAVSSPLRPASPSDWSRSLPCGERFCLKVDAVYKKASSYQTADNCIACHFEKINDSLKKTLDKNLAPSKATGNLMEASKCKRSIFNLKFNVILMSQPILTPPNDDLVTKGDFIANFEKFAERYFGSPGRCHIEEGGVGTVCERKPPAEQEITARALETLPLDATQDSLLQDIARQLADEQKRALQFTQHNRILQDAENQSTQFSVITSELETMNGYFKGFMRIFNELTVPNAEGESPCSVLQAKETCS